MTIALSNVHYHYPKHRQTPVLNIPEWTVSAGERLFVHGPSGSGKSTLLKCLSGLLAPSQGSVEVLGQRLDQLSSRQRDRFRGQHIGYVFQQFNLIPYLNAIENINLVRQFSKKRKPRSAIAEIHALLSALNIQKSLWHMPARELSIGQQQRIAIARALINQPGLLIFDEPTSSLDPDNSLAFMSLLMDRLANQQTHQQANHQTTLIFVSHDMSLTQYFDRVVALKQINTLEAVTNVT